MWKSHLYRNLNLLEKAVKIQSFQNNMTLLMKSISFWNESFTTECTVRCYAFYLNMYVSVHRHTVCWKYASKEKMCICLCWISCHVHVCRMLEVSRFLFIMVRMSDGFGAEVSVGKLCCLRRPAEVSETAWLFKRSRKQMHLRIQFTLKLIISVHFHVSCLTLIENLFSPVIIIELPPTTDVMWKRPQISCSQNTCINLNKHNQKQLQKEWNLNLEKKRLVI